MSYWAHPNRHNHYRQQRRGPSRKRCRRFKNWKQKYGSQEAAEQAAFSMAERFAEYDYRAFECRYCGSWHVGRPHEEEEADFG